MFDFRRSIFVQKRKNNKSNSVGYELSPFFLCNGNMWPI